MQLRPYQQDAIERLRALMRVGKKRLILQACVGLGKTVMASEVIDRTQQKDRRAAIFFLAHRRELVHQASSKLAKFGVRHAIVMGGYPKPTPMDRVFVGTIQSLRRHQKLGRLNDLEVRVIVIDEAHRSMATSYREFVAEYPKAAIIGLTATPTRTDGRGLGKLYEGMVECMTYDEAVQQGFLVPFRYFAPHVPDLTGVKTVGDDYDEGELEKRLNTPKLVGDLVQHWTQYGQGRSTIAFGTTVKHSRAMRDQFLAAGISAAHVDGETPLDERDQIFADFTAGRYQILCNVGIATEGTDIPDVGCIISAFATKSVNKYIQTAGRGSRTAPGKTDCLILDHGGNFLRLGAVEDYSGWTLEDTKGANDRKKEAELKVKEEKQLLCPSCASTFSGTIVCPVCGYVLRRKEVSEDVIMEDGELVEMDRKKAKKAVPVERRREWYAMLLHRAQEKGYKGGWASKMYQDKFGVYPDRTFGVEPMAPDLEVAGWLKSRAIRYAKGRQRGNNPTRVARAS